jgi:hypothetical protein
MPDIHIIHFVRHTRHRLVKIARDENFRIRCGCWAAAPPSRSVNATDWSPAAQQCPEYFASATMEHAVRSNLEETAPIPLSFPAILRNPGISDRFAHLRALSDASSGQYGVQAATKKKKIHPEGKRWIRRKDNGSCFAGEREDDHNNLGH